MNYHLHKFNINDSFDKDEAFLKMRKDRIKEQIRKKRRDMFNKKSKVPFKK